MKKVLIIFSVILLLLLSLTACGEKETEAKNMEQIYKEEGVPVRIIKLKPGQFQTELNYNAVLSGIEESSAYARIGDRVEKIHVKVGDYVQKDQVLLTFPTDNPAAQYYQAKVAFENAKTAHDRIQNLFKSGGISRQTLDNSRANYDMAKANWDAVRQSVKVKAPISGYVTRINVRESDNVKRDEELFTISRTNKMKAKVWISEKEINDVKEGQPAIAVWNGITINGKVVQVDMAANQLKQAFGAVMEFDNPDNLLKCGVTADLILNTYNNPQAIVVERKDILEDQHEYFVYINNDGIAEKRYIKQGRQQGLEIEILEGLNPGDELIVEGQMLLEPGSKVKIIK